MYVRHGGSEEIGFMHKKLNINQVRSKELNIPMSFSFVYYSSFP